MTPSPELTIRPSAPGDMGWIIERHAALYLQEYGFDAEFERYVLLGLAAYAQAASPRSQLWLAELSGRRVGSIGIVDAGENLAQLRWLLVEPEARGLKLGRRLAETALDYAREQSYSGVFLWTLAMLPAARALYARLGFTLSEQKTGLMGGMELIEEKWSLRF